MEERAELIQIRVDSELKDRFYALAEKKGESPSVLLRSFMRQALDNEETQILDLKDRSKSVNTILLEVMSHSHRRVLLEGSDTEWALYKDSFLPEYLDEVIGQSLRDAGITGDSYWRRYWEEIDKNWFTTFREKPPLTTVHLKRDFMDDLRKQIRSGKAGSPASGRKAEKRPVRTAAQTRSRK
jgi:antitoxin component of RelBE/YafQ-DinJ toxin-antitoxin module